MSQTTTTSTRVTPLYRALQVLSGLSVLSVLFQFITAGRLFPDGGPEEIHANGAYALHAFTGLAAVAAFVLWRQAQVSLRLLVLAVVVFGATFVQAATGGRSSLYVHVPGAMILTVGVVWLFIATLRARTAR